MSMHAEGSSSLAVQNHENCILEALAQNHIDENCILADRRAPNATTGHSLGHRRGHWLRLLWRSLRGLVAWQRQVPRQNVLCGVLVELVRNPRQHPRYFF